MRHEFHPEALAEYIAASQHYKEVQSGLETRFIDCIEEALARVCDNPTRWRMFEEEIRGCFTHVFPYVLLYTVESDYILIVAVMHCHREPGYWRPRIEEHR